MGQNPISQSPLIRVSRAAEEILDEKVAAIYDKIKRDVFPPGVLVRLGDRSYRFHRENLLRWLADGGTRGPT